MSTRLPVWILFVVAIGLPRTAMAQDATNKVVVTITIVKENDWQREMANVTIKKALRKRLQAQTLVELTGELSYSSVAASYPEAWHEVKPGMTSDDVRRLIGTPWADNRELKVLDRWLIHENGVELHLDAWIENPNVANSRVERVVRWKQLLGAKFDWYIDPPMP